jgi:hypothetical protein
MTNVYYDKTVIGHSPAANSWMLPFALSGETIGQAEVTPSKIPRHSFVCLDVKSKSMVVCQPKPTTPAEIEKETGIKNATPDETILLSGEMIVPEGILSEHGLTGHSLSGELVAGGYLVSIPQTINSKGSTREKPKGTILDGFTRLLESKAHLTNQPLYAAKLPPGGSDLAGTTAGFPLAALLPLNSKQAKYFDHLHTALCEFGLRKGDFYDHTEEDESDSYEPGSDIVTNISSLLEECDKARGRDVGLYSRHPLTLHDDRLTSNKHNERLKSSVLAKILHANRYSIAIFEATRSDIPETSDSHGWKSDKIIKLLQAVAILAVNIPISRLPIMPVACFAAGSVSHKTTIAYGANLTKTPHHVSNTLKPNATTIGGRVTPAAVVNGTFCTQSPAFLPGQAKRKCGDTRQADFNNTPYYLISCDNGRKHACGFPLIIRADVLNGPSTQLIFRQEWVKHILQMNASPIKIKQTGGIELNKDIITKYKVGEGKEDVDTLITGMPVHQAVHLFHQLILSRADNIGIVHMQEASKQSGTVNICGETNVKMPFAKGLTAFTQNVFRAAHSEDDFLLLRAWMNKYMEPLAADWNPLLDIVPICDHTKYGAVPAPCNQRQSTWADIPPMILTPDLSFQIGEERKHDVPTCGEIMLNMASAPNQNNRVCFELVAGTLETPIQFMQGHVYNGCI